MQLDAQKKSALSKAAMFAVALIWGLSFLVVKNTVDAFPPHLLIALRFTIAFFLLAAVFHKKLKHIDKSYLVAGGVIGIFVFAAFSLQTVGILFTTPGKNAFLTAIYCVVVPFLFWIVAKKRPDGWNVAAAFLCIAGIGLVSLAGDFTIGLGDALTLAGGVLFACQIVAIARFSAHKDPILLTIVQFGTTAALAWIVSLCSETMPALSSIPPAGWGGMLFLAVFPTAICLLLQTVGQKYVPASAASIILSLESVFGVLFSVLLGGEVLTPRLVAGFALIFFAVLLSETKLSFLRKKKTPPQSPPISTVPPYADEETELEDVVDEE